MDTLNRLCESFVWTVWTLFGRHGTSEQKEGARAVKGGRSRALANLAVVGVLVALTSLAQGASGQVLISTVPMVNQPDGVCVNPITNRIYVVNTESPYVVRVINGSNNTVAGDISVGYKPIYCAVNPTTNRIYVTHYFLHTVSVIDGATNSVVASVGLGATNPVGLDVNPITNRIYVAGIADTTQGGFSQGVSVIDGATNTVIATVPVGNSPQTVGVNPATNRIYVGNVGTSGFPIGNTVSVINGATNTVITTLTVGTNPSCLAVNPTTNRIYITNVADNTVSVINGTTNTVIATVGVGGSLGAGAIGVDQSLNRIYVATDLGTPADAVSVIDGASNTVVATVPLAVSPGVVGPGCGLGVNPATHRVYVNHQQGNFVSVIEDLPMVDSVSPTTIKVASPAANSAGWNNTDVTLDFSAIDAAQTGVTPSGVASIVVKDNGAPLPCPSGPTCAVVLSAEGTHTIEYHASDNAGNAEAPKAQVHKIDKAAPTITSSQTPVPNADGWNNTDVTVSFSCSDSLSGIASCNGPTTLASEGIHTLNGTACDVAGNCASTSQTVKIDKTPPTGTCTASPNRLWPPNHKMVNVATTVNVTDNLSGPAGFTLLAVSSNEPDNGLGDGDTPNDIQGWAVGTPDTSGQLRAERSGTGNGRVYRLTYQGADVAGNTATCSMAVAVPHDQRP